MVKLVSSLRRTGTPGQRKHKGRPLVLGEEGQVLHKRLCCFGGAVLGDGQACFRQKLNGVFSEALPTCVGNLPGIGPVPLSKVELGLRAIQFPALREAAQQVAHHLAGLVGTTDTPQRFRHAHQECRLAVAGRLQFPAQDEPIFVPTLRYLPTDVFLEFERSGAEPLTRDEFRAICDREGSETDLREALGVGVTTTRRPPGSPAIIVVR